MKFKKWEFALLIALIVSIPVCGFFSVCEQRDISDKMIRLHIVGASDSVEDQGKKLQVRDAVTEYLGGKLENAGNVNEAKNVVETYCRELVCIAEEVSGQNASCVVDEEYFPTRSYDSFSLPAGKYETVRITLGEGKGRNWWCVVYPALCSSSYSFEDTDCFSGKEIRLITSDAADVKLKFRFLEYFAKIKEYLEK